MRQTLYALLGCVLLVTIAGALRNPGIPTAKLKRKRGSNVHSSEQELVFASSVSRRAVSCHAEGGYVSANDGKIISARGGAKSFWIEYRTPLLFSALVIQKVLADTLTGWTRSRTAYSGATVSMLSELAKFPVLGIAIVLFGGEGWKRIPKTIKGAATQAPFSLGWLAGAYAAQNILYFMALSYISPASYQVLSQSKLIFTALLTVTILQKPLGKRQIGALGALLAGSIMVQFSEMTGAATGGFITSIDQTAALYGGFLTVLGALLAALPNVWYEKILKTKGEDEWVRNLQVTCWIFLWIAASQIITAVRSGLAPFASIQNFANAFFGGSGLDGITPAVWIIIFLKSLNGILIPLTLKFTSNITYLFAKPTSIVVTSLIGAIWTMRPPSPIFSLGSSLVIFAMILYSAKKEQENKIK
mmetsp:Transcript_15313/g.22998  ORF Transcript_15313/g.22998 Transcript_15313/m.22998 type:complete len:417 (+) Transcript_15313:42-1292(+)